MTTALDVASFISDKYFSENKIFIDEMKLQKLLYFSQRESIIDNGELLFEDDFVGWRFGPVVLNIRDVYKNKAFLPMKNIKMSAKERRAILSALKRYSKKNSWSLCRLSYGEISWKNARIGVKPFDNGNNILKADDIFSDAFRTKERRNFLNSIGIHDENK